jgi:hypothetical protein
MAVIVRRSEVAGERAIGGLLFALSLTIYLATAGGSLTTTDAVVTFDVTRSIVEHHSVAMSGNLLGQEAERGRDGRYYAPFGLAQSLYNVPFYVAANAVMRATGFHIGKSDSLPKAFVALGQTLISALIVVEIFRCALLVTGDAGASALAALTLAFASVLWPYSRFGFNQPLACLSLLAAVRCAIVGLRRDRAASLLASGCWLALSLMTRHEMAIAAIPIAAYLWFAEAPRNAVRLKRIAAFVPGVATGAAAWFTYNAVRFGNPLDTGYLRDPTPGFGYPIAKGLVALAASPSASVFLYSPVAIAGAVGLLLLFARRDRSVGGLLLAIVAVFALFYANLTNWLAGRSYGSRYLVVVLPYFGIGWAVVLASLSKPARRTAFIVTFIVGVVVQLPGVVVDYAKVSESVPAGTPFTTEERQWNWSASGLVLNTHAAIRAVPANLDYVLGRRPPPVVAQPASEIDRSFSRQFGFSLDFWWLYLYYLHVLPRSGLAVVLTLFVLVAAVLTAHLRREIGHTDTAPD